MSNLLKADQVAEVLGIKKATVYALVRENRIPHVKLGRNVRFRPAAIDDWLEKTEVAAR